MDEDNFEVTIGKWCCIMTDGELEINDPTYDFVREIAKARGLIPS